MATYYLSTTGNDSTGDGSIGNRWRTLSKASTTVAAGDTVVIQGAAGNAASFPTTSLDYLESAYLSPAVGSTAAGWIRWVAESGYPMPTIGSSAGMLFYSLGWHSFEGLYLVSTGSGYAGFGILNASAGPIRVKSCTINQGGQAGMVGIKSDTGGVIEDTLICSGNSGTPTRSAGGHGILGGGNIIDVDACIIRNCLDDGINDNAGAGMRIHRSRIWGNAGNGISLSSTTTAQPGMVSRNTIDGNAGHGLAVTGTAGICSVAVINNSITNHTGTGKYALTVTDGTTTLNDARKRWSDYNNYHGNTTGNYQNISAGTHDLTVDPGYTSASTGDFSLTTTVLQAGIPT